MSSVVALTLYSVSAYAAEKHVHGHGQLLIAQDASHWQLQFSIPAADLLGFEHEPENDEQRDKMRAVEATVSDFRRVVSMTGDCQVKSQDIDIPHTHHEEHVEDHHHEDISLAYQLTCRDSIHGFTVKLFEFAPSLSALEVQWINDKGQGMTDVTPQAATINW